MPYLKYLVCLCLFVLQGCSDDVWNNPYTSEESGKNVLYSSFSERPKHLDPVRSYSSSEYSFLAQIYEPPLQYHYLKRPYELIPLSAEKMPEVRYLNAGGELVAKDSTDIVFSEYVISIQSGIQYQPHPAFAKKTTGEKRYDKLSESEMNKIFVLSDFSQTATRELLAADYVYQLKRMAFKRLHSPIAGLMGEYIVGLNSLSADLDKAYASSANVGFFDLRDFDLSGVKVLSDYQYSIRINGVYPQFSYWLAMPFFAPMPWEADAFYAQAGLAKKNITLNWYPVGTGPYMLTENNPNLRMILEKNPNFHGETYPSEAGQDDIDLGLLEDAGKALPFIDKAVYSLEKESIPRWNKFLQGFYDTSGISSDSFDQAVQFAGSGDISLTEDMQDKGIALVTSVNASVMYMGFNMLDDLIGGESDQARYLRRAIAIAVNYEEFISIFMNGRGEVAHGVIPPGIFGYTQGESAINTYIYDVVDGKPKRKTIQQALLLMEKAGYKDGVDKETGKPLIIYYEAVSSGPDDKARLNWMRKQFDKIGVQLVIRPTDYNRFQEKMRKGSGQMFNWGWNADYPDPENFLFLLNGQNGKVEYDGENSANYNNAKFNRLFEQMKVMRNTPERAEIVGKMNELLRQDSPWLFGYYPKTFSLHHQWYQNVKPNLMANNTLKYKKIDPVLREKGRNAWNQPIVWPLWLLLILLLLSVWPAVKMYQLRERRSA